MRGPFQPAARSVGSKKPFTGSVRRVDLASPSRRASSGRWHVGCSRQGQRRRSVLDPRTPWRP